LRWPWRRLLGIVGEDLAGELRDAAGTRPGSSGGEVGPRPDRHEEGDSEFVQGEGAGKSASSDVVVKGRVITDPSAVAVAEGPGECSGDEPR
jgi:hypothetical protein